MTEPASASSVRGRFIGDLGFEPDEFQLRAFDVIDDGHHTIVAAPTGAGKTLVAAYAVAQALSRGERLFYTTPIKALSNQKFHDLVAEYGWDRVGLLTGDNAVNPEAPVVVMTTEVLRNMLYAGKPLDRLGAVVLDEVHYLQDVYRGPVWEEVIIHLPRTVQLICLSATVSNASELEEWIETVRGPTSLVVETRRPVELDHHYLVGERASDHLHFIRTVKGTKANPNGFRYDIDPRQLNRRGGGRGHRGRGRPRRKWRIPDRVGAVELLHQRDLLPAIFFIFSRAACDDAAVAVTGSGLILTSTTERDQIRSIVAERVGSLSRRDLQVLNYDRFLQGLEVGVAPHHAGMVPPFKEAVEACFSLGLVKVVFATETLALGINMPARTVVLEKLTKFTGDHHEFLTPAQYTQLTGRAGRRGIDTRGTAVVLWSPFVRFEQVADLALSRQFVLTSSFRPTYNMAANLVRRYEPDRARQLLNLSFAQFRADAGVVRSEHRVERLAERRHQVARRIEREHGPVDELRAALGLGEDQAPAPDRQGLAFALSQLSPGDIIEADGPELPSPLVVVAVAFRGKGRVQVKLVDREAEVYDVGPSAFDREPTVVGSQELPEPYLPNSVSFVHEVSQTLARARLVSAGRRRELGPSGVIRAASDVPPAARKALRRLDRLDRDLAELQDGAARRAESLAGQFDRVIDLLHQRGHLELDASHEARAGQGADQEGGWALTASGQRLARLYHECDLLVVEALEAGLFDDLNGAEVAGLASVFVYEERGGRTPSEPWFPSARLRRRFERLRHLHQELTSDEASCRLPATRAPDAGFVAIAHAWAAGGNLADVLDDEEITAGDFVRTAKQLIDLLRQLALLAADRSTADAARAAAEGVFRDLVAASTLVEGGPDQ